MTDPAPSPDPQKPPRLCAWSGCRKPLVRKRWANGKLESPDYFATRECCDKEHSRLYRMENPTPAMITRDHGGKGGGKPNPANGLVADTEILDRPPVRIMRHLTSDLIDPRLLSADRLAVLKGIRRP